MSVDFIFVLQRNSTLLCECKVTIQVVFNEVQTKTHVCTSWMVSIVFKFIHRQYQMIVYTHTRLFVKHHHVGIYHTCELNSRSEHHDQQGGIKTSILSPRYKISVMPCWCHHCFWQHRFRRKIFITHSFLSNLIMMFTRPKIAALYEK